MAKRLSLPRDGGLVRRLVASRRVRSAVVANAALSVTGLLISVGIARHTGVGLFGQFALAMIIYVAVTGLLRAGIMDTALAKSDTATVVERSSRRTSLAALVLGAGLLVAAGFIGNPFLALVGVCLHGLVALEFSRVMSIGAGDERIGLLQTLAWAVPSAGIAGVSIVTPIPPTAVFAVWSILGAVLGYLFACRSRVVLTPSWPRERSETRAAVLFSLDYAAGSGGSALTTVLIGGFLSTGAVGSLRGAATLLGPANLIASTVRSLIIPTFVRSARAGPRAELRAASRIAIVLVASTLPIVVVVLALPDSFGTQVLGQTWLVARPVMGPLALEVVFGLIGGVPAAGHRAALAGGRSLLLRLVTGVPRPFVVVAAGIGAGVEGAAWAMAAIAALNAGIWWWGYAGLLATRERSSGV